MKKLQFLSLFEKNIEDALQLAEKVLNARISRNIEVELHGAEHSGLLTDVEKAVDIFYLGEERFYRIILSLYHRVGYIVCITHHASCKAPACGRRRRGFWRGRCLPGPCQSWRRGVGGIRSPSIIILSLTIKRLEDASQH